MSSAPDIAGILDNSKELDRLRKEQEEVLTDINKMHKKLLASESLQIINFPLSVIAFLAPEVVEKPGDNSLARLKSLYSHAKELSENEINVSNLLLNQLDALLPSGPPGQPRRKIEGNDQKRKRVKNESDISRLPTSMRAQLEASASLKGEQVAAKVNPGDGDKDEWFVVKVIHFDKETKEFEVLDEEPGDDEESIGQSFPLRKYKVPMSSIIPFPKRNDPSSAPDFPAGRHVLAVYPGTTALYKATVVNGHRKRKTDDYLLEFDDDEEDGSLPQRTVAFHHVVALPEGHRQ